ncbi:hypothetical protein BDQ17DRAFT_1055412 [Cyathus striatus]|nr:hypothetical protein BDQ17DRAFT_1055412 [Cyathus striatus]
MNSNMNQVIQVLTICRVTATVLISILHATCIILISAALAMGSAGGRQFYTMSEFIIRFINTLQPGLLAIAMGVNWIALIAVASSVLYKVAHAQQNTVKKRNMLTFFALFLISIANFTLFIVRSHGTNGRDLLVQDFSSFPNPYITAKTVMTLSGSVAKKILAVLGFILAYQDVPKKLVQAIPMSTCPTTKNLSKDEGIKPYDLSGDFKSSMHASDDGRWFDVPI